MRLPKALPDLLKILRRNKVARFQTDGKAFVIEFEGPPREEEGGSVDAVGFKVEANQDEEEDED